MKSLLIILFILIGLFLSSFGLYFLYKEGNIRNWPTIVGTVQDTQIADFSRSSSTPSFKPIVTYQYSVNGKDYSNNRLTVISKTYGTLIEAEAIVAKYPVQQKVVVLYNPQNPQDSILKHQSKMISYFIIIFGLLISSIAIIIMRISSKK